MTDTPVPAHPVELRRVSKRYGTGGGQQVTAATMSAWRSKPARSSR